MIWFMQLEFNFMTLQLQFQMINRQWTFNDSESLAQAFQQANEVVPSKDERMAEVHLHEIKLIQSFLKIHRPLLSQARRWMIEQKLQLQKMAQKQTRRRTKDDEYFVRYDYNPLSQKENAGMNRMHNRRLKDSQSARSITPLGKHEREVSMPEAVCNLKANNFGRSQSQILKTSATTKHLSSQIFYNAKTLAYDFNNKNQGQKRDQVKSAELSFEQILKMADKNFYAQDQGPINIFDFMRGNQKSILSKDILGKYHFNFTSCVDKIQPYKIHIYRELSQLGRYLVFKTNISKRTRLDVLNSNEMSISLKDIRFNDLISISSGRLDAPLVYSILFEGNAQKDASPNSSFVDPEEQINYQANQEQKRTDYCYKLNAKQERDQYLKLSNSIAEQKSVKKYQKIYHDVKSNLEQVKRIKSNTINDVKLHTHYKNSINKDVDMLQKLDRKNSHEPERLIRQNKIDKSRQERMKIKEMIRTIKLTNHYREKLAPIISKSKQKL